MNNILLGLLLLGIAILILVYSHHLVAFFGVSSWAERKLGSTRNLYVLIAIVILFAGCLFLFGIIDQESMQSTMDVETTLGESSSNTPRLSE